MDGKLELMQNKMQNKIIILLLLPAVFISCAKTARTHEITVKDLGVKMEVPPGWKVGLPAIQPGKKFKPAASGDHCFPSEKTSYPFGRVWAIDLAPFPSLSDFVNTIPTLHGLTLAQTPIQVCGYEGIEVLSSGLGENKQPVKGIYQYILKGDTVIIASFLTLADSFPSQESLFRAALNTIEIK